MQRFVAAAFSVFAVVLVAACEDRAAPALGTAQATAIEEAVRNTATELLHEVDAAAVLSYYAPGPTVASNGFLYPSFDSLAAELKGFYGTLREINLAVWDDIRVDVIGADAAVFTGTFRWSSTDTAGVRMELEGAWSAVFVRDDDRWKIRVRHESFTPTTS